MADQLDNVTASSAVPADAVDPDVNWTSIHSPVNGNSSLSDHSNELMRRQLLVIHSFLFVAIVVGNLTVLIYIIMSKPGLKSRMNFFIVNLAITDLAVAMSVLTSLLWQQVVRYWYAGEAMCKITRFVQGVVTYASTYVLVALSIDRFDAIARPMNFLGSGLRAKVLVGSAWATSGVFSLPMFLLNVVKPSKQDITKDQCVIDMSEEKWRLYMTLVFVTLFVVPALIITLCYTIIVVVIWRKSVQMPAVVMKTTSTSQRSNDVTAATQAPDSTFGRYRHHPQQHLGQAAGGNGSNRESPRVNGCRYGSSRNTCTQSAAYTLNTSVRQRHHDNTRMSRGVIPQAKVKTVKMTFVIVLAFVFCWSPYLIYNILFVYHIVEMNPAVAVYFQTLAPLNSVANPIIYCLFSTGFIRAFRRVFCCLSPIKFFRRLTRTWCQCCYLPGLGRTNSSRSASCSVIGAVDHLNHTPNANNVRRLVLGPRNSACGAANGLERPAFRYYADIYDREDKFRSASTAASVPIQVDVVGGYVAIMSSSSTAVAGPSGGRRQSGPPCVRSRLTEQETQILMTNLQDRM